MQAATEAPVKLPTLDELNQEMARRHHLDFITYTWTRGEPYVVGRHTRAICDRIDRAIADYRAGRSTFIVVNVPFRHGKSEILSRHLPPHFLGLFPDQHVLLATYSAELAGDHSRDARRIMRSEQYQQVFPGVSVADDSSAADRWGIQGKAGGMFAVGFGGSMTGRGYACGLVDDFLKSREEAESALNRERVWQSFTNDFLTRRAPVSITFVLNTRWHQDDLVGRIQKAMSADPTFPRFEVITFPASSDGTFAPDTLLFPERFPAEWYAQQRAALGTYGTASLLQQNPIPRGGNLLKTGKIQIHNSMDEFPADLRYGRAWDLASTVKETLKADPDFTVGLKGAIQDVQGVPHIWIADVVRGQWEAPERDRRIVLAAQLDGGGVRVGTESVAGYKDTFTRLQQVLAGVATVQAIVPAGDKMVRASPLEPIFEAGNVHLLRAPWTADFLAELEAFPSGNHDDQVDALTGLWIMLQRTGVRLTFL
jgi:predicted phage terminase large subunit-like protein